MLTAPVELPAASVATPPADSGRLAEVMARTAARDADAFAELYDLLAARVFGLVLRVVVGRALAEETTQDVFLEVWQKAGSFDPSRGAVTSWIMTIAHRRAVDRVRAQQSAADRERTVGMRALDIDRDVVGDHVADWSAAREVRAAIATLTAKQRRVVSLAYIDGLSQSEIATLTRTPLGTVKSTTRAALARLRRALRPV